MGILKKIGSALTNMVPGLNVVGNLIGSGLNYKAQKDANAQNLKINQMNNDFNAAEAEKSRKWQEQFWQQQFDATNNYNSPANQRKLLEEAGFNPWLSGADVGSATSNSANSTQGAFATSNSPARMMAPQFKAPDITGNLLSWSQAMKSISETQAQDTFNLMGPDFYRAQIDKMRGDTNWFNVGSDVEEQGRKWGKIKQTLDIGILDSQATNYELQNNIARATYSNLLLDAGAKGIINKYLDSQQQAELQFKAAQYYDLMASGILNYEKCRESIANQLLLAAKTAGQRIDNRIANETATKLIYATNMANFVSGNYNALMSGKSKGIPHNTKNAFMLDMNSKTLDVNLKKIFNEKQQYDLDKAPIFDALEGANMFFNGLKTPFDIWHNFEDIKKMWSSETEEGSTYDPKTGQEKSAYERTKRRRRGIR